MRGQVQTQGQALKRARLRKRHQRGQATFEYSFVSHVLMFMGTGIGWYFTVYLFKALNAFYDSIYFVLQSSVP